MLPSTETVGNGRAAPATPAVAKADPTSRPSGPAPRKSGQRSRTTGSTGGATRVDDEVAQVGADRLTIAQDMVAGKELARQDRLGVAVDEPPAERPELWKAAVERGLGQRSRQIESQDPTSKHRQFLRLQIIGQVVAAASDRQFFDSVTQLGNCSGGRIQHLQRLRIEPLGDLRGRKLP